MRSSILLIALILTAGMCFGQGPTTPASSSAAQSAGAAAADEAGIRQAALDYIEGFYEANPERMEHALHPDLAKRIVVVNAEGRGRVEHMSAMTLVQITRTKKPTRKSSNRRTSPSLTCSAMPRW